RSDSESVSAGSLDAVDASVFRDFDYVALGHLHRPQSIGGGQIRYAGSPLKYSFSEVSHAKSVTIVDFGPKGQLEIKQCPLTPLRDLREIKGPLEELLRWGQASKEGQEDYFRIILTDEEELYDPLGQLRPVYPNLMSLEFENRRTRGARSEAAAAADLTSKGPLDLFAEFYALQNNEELSPEQVRVLQEIFAEAGGGKL
ncbi:MAG: exonuclease sbcCD subunit D, partial [Firmicutes bacterium]|nr:exonuclease sbcCD subunit D [Bacillota bacterium]